MHIASRLLRTTIIIAMAVSPFERLAADVGLPGSPSSMVHQHAIAVLEDYTFLRTPSDVWRLAQAGGLVPIAAGANYTLSRVSFAYARPEVRSFIEHFAAEYRDATGSRLVVTSLVRPELLQPRNASVLSVHPAGMAVDFRVPATASARAFLERALLDMERLQLLDVTRERRPAHYHVAVFPEAYRPYAARQDSVAAATRAPSAAQVRATAPVASRSLTPAIPVSPAPPAPPQPARIIGVVAGMLALVIGAALITHDVRQTLV